MISQYLKDSSPSLRTKLEKFERENIQIDNSQHHIFSSGEILNKSPTQVYHMDISNVVFDVKNNEPLHLDNLERQKLYLQDKSLKYSQINHVKDHVGSKRPSKFMISNLLNKSVKLQNMSDFNSTQNVSQN